MFDRDRFIADCHDALAQARPAAVIRDLVARAIAEPRSSRRRWSVRYRRGPHGLVTAGGKRLERTDTALLGETIIHGVANALCAFTGGDPRLRRRLPRHARSEWTPDTLIELPFDPGRARRAYAGAIDRWSREGL